MSEFENIKKLKSSPLGAGGLGLERLYFIGIGGIGMSAIARYFNSKGVTVSGYDRTSTPLTKQLEAEGIAIHYTEDLSLAPKEAQLVVYTPAVPANHAELVYYRENGYEVVKRSDVLKLITESSFNICVGGTHGKTTVTSMIAHILRDSGYGCNAFLGGIASNYGTNFWSHERNVCVVEADEYDRSFLKLAPNVAVITAMDADHLDIYGTAEEVENAFVQFSQKVKEGGCIISRHGMNRSNEFNAASKFTYSYNESAADVSAKDLKVREGSYHFNVQGKGWKLEDVVLHMGGLHNIENSIAAITVAKYLDIEDDKIKNAVASYKGVKRRFEYVVNNQEHVLIDDYAHHPEELKALISGVRSLFSKRLVLVFQPHLYSRTKDNYKAFAEVLDTCDEVILLPVYPARELPMEGVNSEMILAEMKLEKKQVLSKEDLQKWTEVNMPGLLVMAGAGDIDTLIEPVKSILTSQ